MNSTHQRAVVLAAVCGLLAGSLCCARPAMAADILVGLASADITPPPGGRTTGYSASPPTDGVHDPLSARVILLQSDETTVALVVWDLCVTNSPWLFEQAKELGIDHLLLANTHTHAGPRIDEPDFPQPGATWRRTFEQQVLAAIKEAQQQLFPARFAAAEGQVRLGYNRLVRQPGGFALTHFENPDLVPYDPVDTTVGVLRISDAQDQVRAVLVNYACHAVVLGPQNRKISADYPGALRRLVEQQLPAGAMCVFVQGCGADINPLRMARGDDRAPDFEVVEQVGAELAASVLAALEHLKAQPGHAQKLAVAQSMLDVSGRFDKERRATLGVTTLLLNDDIGIMTMPGEPFHRYQVDFRQKAGLPHAMVFGYCCNGPYDWPGYLPDIESAAYGGYGASDTTHVEVGAGERLVLKALEQLYTLQGRLRPAPVRHVGS